MTWPWSAILLLFIFPVIFILCRYIQMSKRVSIRLVLPYAPLLTDTMRFFIVYVSRSSSHHNSSVLQTLSFICVWSAVCVYMDVCVWLVRGGQSWRSKTKGKTALIFWHLIMFLHISSIEDTKYPILQSIHCARETEKLLQNHIAAAFFYPETTNTVKRRI